jgi:hypothetical protein
MGTKAKLPMFRDYTAILDLARLSGKDTKISPCALRLLTPALLTRSLPLTRPSRACGFAHIPFAASRAAQVSFGEEREKAGATFVVLWFSAQVLRGISSRPDDSLVPALEEEMPA